MNRAMQLAVEGNLLQRRPLSDAPAKLTVVTLFRGNGKSAPLAARVYELFREYGVTGLPEDDVPEFVGKVESETHAVSTS